MTGVVEVCGCLCTVVVAVGCLQCRVVVLNAGAVVEMQIFFTDTLKFFVSLYGHKLPVLSMDISSDGALLASGSGDKNVKIWGMDFGDCRKSLFAHGDR